MTNDELIELIKNSDLEALMGALDGLDEVDLYRWLLIAEDYDVPGAADAVGDIWQALVSRWGDEVDGAIQVEIAFDHMMGENGLPRNEELGFLRLKKSKVLNPFQIIDLSSEIERVMAGLSTENKNRLKEFIED